MLRCVQEAFRVPIGLRLAQTARVVERAFDDALAEAGGTLPVWLILLNLKIRKPDTQRELADAVGVREATLTHHLNAMDARGLITRTRDAANRRVQVVELTEEGEAAFLRLRGVAISFDAKLRGGLSPADTDRLDSLLCTLSANATGVTDAGDGRHGGDVADGTDAGDSTGARDAEDAVGDVDVVDGASAASGAGVPDGAGVRGGAPSAPPWAGLAEPSAHRATRRS